MKNRIRLWGRVVGVAVFALMLASFAAPMAFAKNLNNPGVLPPQSHSHGKTYGEWSAEWWQWALSLPADSNPFFDETGCANGANGQHGSVWFLTGVINSVRYGRA